MTKSRNLHQPRHVWQPAEIELMRQRYADESSDALAAALGLSLTQVYSMAHRLRLVKSPTFRASVDSGRIGPRNDIGAATRFKPGQVSHNKGVKGVCGVHPNSRLTQFKPGHAQNGHVPIGTVVMKSNGYLMRKVSQTGHGPTDWKLEHRLRWEAMYGSIPRDHVVAFKSADRTNTSLANLELVSKADLLRRHTVHNLPPELVEVIQLKGALTRKLNRHEQQPNTR